MTKKSINITVGAGIIAVAITVATIFIGGGDNTEARKEGPEDVVIEFTEAMKTGDFDRARSLCDTALMRDYFDAYIQKWETKSSKDSAAFASAVKILGETAIEINKVENMDGTCLIDYTLKMDGNTRKCHASLKKEEGEWKIAEITSKI